MWNSFIAVTWRAGRAAERGVIDGLVLPRAGRRLLASLLGVGCNRGEKRQRHGPPPFARGASVARGRARSISTGMAPADEPG